MTMMEIAARYSWLKKLTLVVNLEVGSLVLEMVKKSDWCSRKLMVVVLHITRRRD